MGKVMIADDGILRRPISTARLEDRLRRFDSAWRRAHDELRRLTLDLIQRDAPLHPRTRRRVQAWADALANWSLKSFARRVVAVHTVAHGGPPDPESLTALRWHAARVEFWRAVRRGEDPKRALRRYRVAAVKGLRLVGSPAERAR